MLAEPNYTFANRNVVLFKRQFMLPLNGDSFILVFTYNAPRYLLHLIRQLLS